ncbi:hypothetical protein BT93_G0153 [Corymbia citriodora subsp. variegata]|nr:hypothetical protein BT93_G0153 [Corymbia citriodora subsp. variegata]
MEKSTPFVTPAVAMNPIAAVAGRSPNPWPRKRSGGSPPRSRSLVLCATSLLAVLAFFYFSYACVSTSLLRGSLEAAPRPSRRCEPRVRALGQKFLSYAPHSGFSNQLSEFKNAIVVAAILNRTLVVPPVLDHHAVALGSCPKFRVLGGREIRLAVWESAVELLRTGRYVSMADIIDISSLVSSSVIRTIDFRVFTSIWCGVNIDLACDNGATSESPLLASLKQCGSFLSGFNGNVDECLYSVDEDCRSTVWTYQNGHDGELDSFQPDEQLKRKKKITYVRRRRDVYNALGPGSQADSAALLAFGSLFTSAYKGSQLYFDIHEAPKDPRIQSIIEKIEFIPFVPQILSAGKEFALTTIKSPFLCAQLRLLDGQFKNHRETTFLALKEKVESLRQNGPLPIHIFVMTDLPEGNWSRTYLGDLAGDVDNFKLHFLQDEDELVIQTAKELAVAGHGLRIGFVANRFTRMDKLKKLCSPRKLTDVLLYIEEVICSCASLGFVGTAGSTIAESIVTMRKHGVCSS